MYGDFFKIIITFVCMMPCVLTAGGLCNLLMFKINYHMFTKWLFMMDFLMLQNNKTVKMFNFKLKGQ